jgi:hypothetical protein
MSKPLIHYVKTIEPLCQNHRTIMSKPLINYVITMSKPRQNNVITMLISITTLL